MIPSNAQTLDFDLADGLEDAEPAPTKTWRLNTDALRIGEPIDGAAALAQSIEGMLLTPRYSCELYSWDYGSEFDELIGMPEAYCEAEVERMVSEALMQDDRIESVDSFEFTTQGRVLTAAFVVHTIYGEIDQTKEVAI